MEYENENQTQNHGLGSKSVKRRRRTRLACQACRDRKIRCDGGTPRCDSCQRKNIEAHCVYPAEGTNLNLSNVHHRRNHFQVPPPLASAPGLGRPPRPRPNPIHAGSYASLTPEARPVSASIPDFDAYSAGGIAATADAHLTSWVRERNEREKGSSGPRWTPRSGSDSTHHRPLSAGTTERNHRGKQHDDDALSAVDATAGDEAAPIVLGSSSGVGFMEEACEALHSRSDGRTSVRSPSVVHVPDERWYLENSLRSTRARNSQSSLGLMGADLSLPPRRVTDHLLQIYWEEIHPLSPLLHEQTFMTRYHHFWTEGQTTPQLHKPGTRSLVDLHICQADQIFHATLNLIFAIVYQRAAPQDTSNHETAQETFFNRAERLLSPDLMEAESLQLVQALVLKATYIREADMTNRSWIAVGTAVRVAQAAGLYAETTTGSQAAREERKRVWYNCITMDRIQSMTYGRPSMISGPRKLSVPQAIDDEYLNVNPTGPDNIQPDNIPSRMAFFTFMISLSDIASQVRRFFYDLTDEPSNGGSSYTRQYAAIIELDADLGRWYNTLPPYLRDPAASQGGSCFLRQCIYLKCQFLHWRVVLFRHLIVDLARDRASSPSSNHHPTPLQQILSRGCVETCVHTMQELLNVIEPNIGTDLLPAGWYITSYHLYGIGTITAVLLLTPTLLQDAISVPELQHAWSQCLKCFEKYDRLGIRFARRCILGLKRMFGKPKDAAADGIHTGTTAVSDPNITVAVEGGVHASNNPCDSNLVDAAAQYGAAESQALQHQQQESNGGLILDPCWLNEDFHWLSSINFNDTDYRPSLEGDFWDFTG